MSIGDEIRGFVRRSYADEHMDPRELLALADRVDAEMVELPRDADGEPIHLGDTAYATDDPSIEYVVSCIELSSNGKISIGLESRGIHTYRNPPRISHERHDSLEAIAGELDDLSESGEMADEASVDMRDLAERIRKIARGRDDGRR